MKFTQKALSSLVALAVGATLCVNVFPQVDVEAASSAQDLVTDMGMGWNLGNTFDSADLTWVSTKTPTAVETGWGNKVTTQAMINNIKKSGFDSVRIPITWFEMMDSAGNIDTAYLARIKEVVDYCYANDMYVIINMHHDGTSTHWLGQNGIMAITKFNNIWTQIANYFKTYDQKLVFEGMNEVEFDYTSLETMNQAFVDTVRATGGNNANRLLLIAGANTDLEKTCSSSFKMPTDKASMLAVSIHYYTPPQFCVATPGTSWGYSTNWGTDAEKQALLNDFQKMKTTFVDKGIPVIVGEYGVLNETKNGKDVASINLWLKSVASAALNTGIAGYLWDCSGAGDMNYFNRESLSFYDSAVAQIYKDLKGSGASVPDGYILTDRVTVKGTMQKAGNYGTGISVDLTPYDGVAELETAVFQFKYTNMTSAGYYGYVATTFNGTINGVEHGFAYKDFSTSQDDEYITVTFDGKALNGDKDADENLISYPCVLDYDYLNAEIWYAGSSGTLPGIGFEENVTLIFKEAIYVKDDGTIVPPETTTTTTSTTTTTTTSTTTTTTTSGGSVVYGDTDGNGVVDINDLVLLNRVLSLDSAFSLTDEGKLNADVAYDTKVTNADSVKLMQYLSQSISYSELGK